MLFSGSDVSCCQWWMGHLSLQTFLLKFCIHFTHFRKLILQTPNSQKWTFTPIVEWNCLICPFQKHFKQLKLGLAAEFCKRNWNEPGPLLQSHIVANIFYYAAARQKSAVIKQRMDMGKDRVSFAFAFSWHLHGDELETETRSYLGNLTKYL